MTLYLPMNLSITIDVMKTLMCKMQLKNLFMKSRGKRKNIKTQRTSLQRNGLTRLIRKERQRVLWSSKFLIRLTNNWEQVLGIWCLFMTSWCTVILTKSYHIFTRSDPLLKLIFLAMDNSSPYSITGQSSKRELSLKH